MVFLFELVKFLYTLTCILNLMYVQNKINQLTVTNIYNS